METILEQLIADFQERMLPSFTRRHIQLPWLHGKIDTVIGYALNRQNLVSFSGYI